MREDLERIYQDVMESHAEKKWEIIAELLRISRIYPGSYYDSLVLAERKWELLADNPDITASMVQNECPVCSYRNARYGEYGCRGRNSNVSWGKIPPCFLRHSCRSDFTIWEGCTTEQTRVTYATKIYLTILNERLKHM